MMRPCESIEDEVRVELDPHDTVHLIEVDVLQYDEEVIVQEQSLGSDG